MALEIKEIDSTHLLSARNSQREEIDFNHAPISDTLPICEVGKKIAVKDNIA